MASWWASSYLHLWPDSNIPSISLFVDYGRAMPGPSYGAARVTNCGRCRSLSLSLAVYWSRHGPSLSLISLHHLSGNHQAPHPASTWYPGIAWSQHYLDLAIRGLFPLINKTLGYSPSAGIIYTRLPHAPVSQSRLIILNIRSHYVTVFIVTNVRARVIVRNASGPELLSGQSSLLSCQFVEKPQRAQSKYLLSRHWYSSVVGSVLISKLKFLSHRHSSSRICSRWGPGHCCGILVTSLGSNIWKEQKLKLRYHFYCGNRVPSFTKWPENICFY